MGIASLQDIVISPMAGAHIAEGRQLADMAVDVGSIGGPAGSPVDNGHQLAPGQSVLRVEASIRVASDPASGGSLSNVTGRPVASQHIREPGRGGAGRDHARNAGRHLHKLGTGDR